VAAEAVVVAAEAVAAAVAAPVPQAAVVVVGMVEEAAVAVAGTEVPPGSTAEPSCFLRCLGSLLNRPSLVAHPSRSSCSFFSSRNSSLSRLRNCTKSRNAFATT
jgi:hypothetical protein